MKISKNEQAEFFTNGILSFKHLIPKSKTGAAKDYLLSELTRLRLRENGKWHTRKFDGISPFQVSGKIAQGIHPHTHLDNVIPKELGAYLNILAGCKLQPSQPRPQILVTPPQKETWSIPETGWHVDLNATSVDSVPGIQVFVLLDDIAPKGGATMAIRGSHKSRDLSPTPDRVAEMCGKAGDVYLMDMRVLHAPSINATKNARMMLTSRYLNPKFGGQ